MPMERKHTVPTPSELSKSLTEAYGSGWNDLRYAEQLKQLAKEVFFPEILLEIMSNPKHSHIIGWETNRKSFAIHNIATLSNVLCKYQIKSNVFIEELYRWGFQKVSGQDVFHHEYFRKDKTGWIVKMECGSGKKKRGKKRTAKSSSDGGDTGSGKKMKKKLGNPSSGVIDLSLFD